MKLQEEEPQKEAAMVPTILARESEAALRLRTLLGTRTIYRQQEVEVLEALQREAKALQREGQEACAAAREEAEGIRQRARDEGRAEGLREWLEAIARAREEYARVQSEVERDMVTLAFHIARRIIGRAIEVDPTVVAEIIGEALVAARGRRRILVRVHPDDLSELKARRAEFIGQLDGATLHFEAQNGMERGGCVIETESGRVDGCMETRLETLRRALMEGE